MVWCAKCRVLLGGEYRSFGRGVDGFVAVLHTNFIDRAVGLQWRWVFARTGILPGWGADLFFVVAGLVSGSSGCGSRTVCECVRG
jgi:hypothetical protein